MTKNATCFEWDPEEEKFLQQVQAAMQAALPLRPCDPAGTVELEVTVADGILFGDFGSPCG